ncbi:MAG: hypothetical protein AAF944_01590 [Bacteroidota bacterium]
MVYYFCYEHGYAVTADEKVVLVTWQAYMDQAVHRTMFQPRFREE